jgi:hypothetical protein
MRWLLLWLLLGVGLARAQDNFPDIEVRSTPLAAPGVTYFANFPREGVQTPGQGTYVIGVDNQGGVVFRQELLRPSRAFNVQAHPDGTISYYVPLQAGIGGRGGVGMNGEYRRVDMEGNLLATYTTLPPLTNTTAHDFLELGDGTYVLLSHDSRTMDLTPYGGSPEAIVVTGSIQVIDEDLGPVWTWDGWEHLPLEQVTDLRALQVFPPNPVDYVHINSIALAPDGNLIASLRNQDALIKIDRATGEVLWRFGGPEAVGNDFVVMNDPLGGFSRQHHVSVLENGNLLLFDNGNLHDPPISRAVEYKLDEERFIATLVWSYQNGQYGPTLGSAQRLPNGNTLISWGSSQDPHMTEVTPDGRVAMEIWLPEDHMVYRALKFDYSNE